MAYATRNLSVLAYANDFTLWHYETADGAAALAGFGYFDQAADLFRRGDIVIATTADGASLLSVASCDGERVSIAPMLRADVTAARESA